MTIRSRVLGDGLAVPVQAQPGEAIDNGPDRILRRARAVRILDPQQEPAAVVAGE